MFAPGEAFQFDFSHEDVEVAGQPMRVKAAHVRLCASRAVYVRVYPRETQEMVFDANARAFAFFGGVPTRGIYDNMKTAVDAVFVGKQRVETVQDEHGNFHCRHPRPLQTHPSESVGWV